MTYILRLLHGAGLIISVVLLINLTVVGVLASYLNIPQLYWLGAFLPFVLIFSRAVKLKFLRLEMLSLLLLFLYLSFSWIFLTDGAALKMISVKDYLIPTVALIVAARIRFNPLQLKSIYEIFRLVVFFQPVFLLHQYVVLARQSVTRSFDWDLMVGTFGFNPAGGGGNSSGLLLFICFYLVVVISKIRFYRAGWLDYVAILISILSIFMMETKVVVILAILGFISLLQRKDFFEPAFVVKSMFLNALFLVALLFSYNASFSTGSKEGQSTSEYLTEIQEGYFDEDVINYETGEVSRQASLMLWRESNFNDGIDHLSVFGFGLTSSKYSNAHVNEAVSYASYVNFASTQVATYLWDIGIFGCLLAFFVLLQRAYTLLVISTCELYAECFRRGALFLCMTLCIYPFYSSVLHQNSVTFTLVVLLFSLNFENRKRFR